MWTDRENNLIREVLLANEIEQLTLLGEAAKVHKHKDLYFCE